MAAFPSSANFSCCWYVCSALFSALLLIYLRKSSYDIPLLVAIMDNSDQSGTILGIRLTLPDDDNRTNIDFRDPVPPNTSNEPPTYVVYQSRPLYRILYRSYQRHSSEAPSMSRAPIDTHYGPGDLTSPLRTRPYAPCHPSVRF